MPLSLSFLTHVLSWPNFTSRWDFKFLCHLPFYFHEFLCLEPERQSLSGLSLPCSPHRKGWGKDTDLILALQNEQLYCTMNSVISAVPHFSHVKLGFCCFSLPRHLFTLSTLRRPEKLTRVNEEPQLSAPQTLGGWSLLPVFASPNTASPEGPCVHTTQAWHTHPMWIPVKLVPFFQVLPQNLFVSHLWTSPSDTPSPHKDSPLSSLWHIWRASFCCLTPTYTWEAITNVMVTLRWPVL